MSAVFKHDEYVASRPTMLGAYVEQQVAFLKSMNPEASEDKLREFVLRTAKANYVEAEVDVVVHPSPGNTIREVVPLSKHYQKNISSNIISPSGTVYIPPTIKESFLKISLETKLKERKVYKRIYLDALEKGDMITAGNNNLLQATTKIFANSAPGAMNSVYNVLYDLPGYNAITSTARQSVKYGYAHTERMIEANLYITSVDDAIGYCMRLQTIITPEVMQTVDAFNLHIPTVDELTDYFTRSLMYYNAVDLRPRVKAFVSRLPLAVRTMAFYASCLRNLFQYNTEFFKGFLKNFFRTDMPAVDDSVEVKEIFKVDDDMLAMITSLNYEFLGKDEEGNWFNVVDALKGNPAGVRKLIAISRHMQACMEKYRSIFSTFIRVDTDIAKLGFQQNMIRKCVIISDTDSVIFSTQSMIEWYTGSATFSDEAYQINAFTVYTLSRSLEHVFARLSCGFGMVGDGIKKIAMKNEFLYPIMIRTAIRKHYAGIVKFQEGKLLAKPKKDIKGLQFRSSTLSSFTNKSVEDFLITTMNKIVDQGTIEAKDVLEPVANFEAKLYNSLMSGEKTFLQTVSIKNAEDYADPSISSYFYYELWQEVFVPVFDGIQLPNKCFKLPLLGKGKVLKSEAFLKSLHDFNPGVHDRLLRFMAKHEKKAITQILFPPTLPFIPDILKQVLDVRSILYSNGSPFYLGLASMGFAYNFGSDSYIVSDFYNPNNIVVPHVG